MSPLADKIHLLTGIGGNIVVIESPEGLLMIDSGVPEAASSLVAQAGKIGTGKVARLLNTHWHYDHVGGNVAIGKTGAKIFAQENVKARVSSKQHMEFFNRDVEPLAAEGIPAETFKDKGKTKFGGQSIAYDHLPPAHTDGDTVYHLHEANILHGGDLLFSGLYPFIDYSSGGSLKGMASNADRIAKMVDNATTIVPGHGPLMKKADVMEYAAMLHGCYAQISKLIDEKKTLAQVLAAAPTKEFDAKWGGGFLKPEQWVTLNYAGMTKHG